MYEDDSSYWSSSFLCLDIYYPTNFRSDTVRFKVMLTVRLQCDWVMCSVSMDHKQHNKKVYLQLRTWICLLRWSQRFTCTILSMCLNSGHHQPSFPSCPGHQLWWPANVSFEHTLLFQKGHAGRVWSPYIYAPSDNAVAKLSTDMLCLKSNPLFSFLAFLIWSSSISASESLAKRESRTSPPSGAVIVRHDAAFGEFTSIQAAVNSLPDDSSSRSIFIYSGQTHVSRLCRWPNAICIRIQGLTGNKLLYPETGLWP